MNRFSLKTDSIVTICSDYHLVHEFQEDCKNEIKNLRCGRIFDDTQAETENVSTV